MDGQTGRHHNYRTAWQRRSNRNSRGNTCRTQTGNKDCESPAISNTPKQNKMKSARASSPVELRITCDGSSYEIHTPFDVWDGRVDVERCWYAEFSQTISAR